MNIIQTRLNRWIQMSHKVVSFNINQYAVYIFQQLAWIDVDLIANESEVINAFLNNTGEMFSEQKAIQFQKHLTLSYLWVLGAYELIRIMKNKRKDGAVKKLYRDFRRLRIPLAKLEPAKGHENEDNPIATPIIQGTHISWVLNNNKTIPRIELSDKFLNYMESVNDEI